MRNYWLTVCLFVLADGAAISALLMRDGGPEGLVWLAFLVGPLIIAELCLGGLVLHAVRRPGR